MIKLTKKPEPQVLIDNGENWKNALLAKYAAGLKPTITEASRYRHPDIKDQLRAETNGKCAYCESKLEHIHHGDIEHIYPKSLAREKTFEWGNLTLACEICNQNKSNLDPNMTSIIDPYIVDPEEHLLFMGAFVYPKGTALGISSITIFDLNRAALCEKRKEKQDNIMKDFNDLAGYPIPDATKKLLHKNLVSSMCADSSEYSAMNRKIIEEVNRNLPEEIKS